MSIRLEIEGVTAEEAMGYIQLGLEHKRDAVQAQLDAITGKSANGTAGLAKSPAKSAQAPKKPNKPAAKAKGKMSAAGKAAIVAAQKKRWANVRKKERLAKTAQAASAQEPTSDQVPQEAGAEAAAVAELA